MLRWEWNYRIGTLETESRNEIYKYFLYKGNAKLIVIAEWKDDNGEDRYNVHDFFASKEDMNCKLGLVKETSNHYVNTFENWMKITFYKDMIGQRDLIELCTAIIKAFPNITIEIKETEGGK